MEQQERTMRVCICPVCGEQHEETIDERRVPRDDEGRPNVPCTRCLIGVLCRGG